MGTNPDGDRTQKIPRRIVFTVTCGLGLNDTETHASSWTMEDIVDEAGDCRASVSFFYSPNLQLWSGQWKRRMDKMRNITIGLIKLAYFSCCFFFHFLYHHLYCMSVDLPRLFGGILCRFYTSSYSMLVVVQTRRHNSLAHVTGLYSFIHRIVVGSATNYIHRQLDLSVYSHLVLLLWGHVV